MKHYIDRLTGEVFAYEEDGSQDAYIREDLERLSDAELLEVRAAQEAALAPTSEQVLQAANDKRDVLLSTASIRIAPLQDAVDLGEATEEDESMLLSWKKYRVDVNRVSRQSGFPSAIEWPVEPV